MKDHLSQWWAAHLAWLSGVAVAVWPQLREYICSHPVISGGGIGGVLLLAILKQSPLTKVAGLLILSFLFGSSTKAQNVPPSDPFESGPPVQMTGAYSNVSSATANGFEIEVSRRFSQHFWGHVTYFEHATPGAKVAVAGPMYQYSLAHAFKNQSTFADLSKVDLFAKAGIGASHAEPCPAGSPSTCVDLVGGKNPAFKIAFGVGGGFNYHVNDMLTVRPAEIEYFRTAIGGLTVKNYSQFISGLTVAFGKH